MVTYASCGPGHKYITQFSPNSVTVNISSTKLPEMLMSKRISLILAFLLLALTVFQSCDFLPVKWPNGEERAHFPKDELNFMVIGDWGRKGKDYQKIVAAGLGIGAMQDSSRFIISTGDNFYEEGVKNTNDSHFRKSYEDVYRTDPLNVRWYITLGNHDHKGNIDAQIAYSKQSARWYLPANYYEEEILLDDSTRALFVFLDTTPLRDEIISFSSASTELENEAQQLQWLNETLAQSRAEWKIVVGHHPLFSVGEAHRDNDAMIGNLRQILEQHQVQVYFSGHAHSLQHLKPKGSVNYFISGAGSKIRKVHPDEVTEAAVSVPGFIAASLTKETLIVQLVDFQGKVHHEAIIPR